MNPDVALALALDAFLAEHRGCWRLYGEGLESEEDGSATWNECGCGARLVLRKLKYR
jgi:hypothetical protein